MLVVIENSLIGCYDFFLISLDYQLEKNNPAKNETLVKSTEAYINLMKHTIAYNYHNVIHAFAKLPLFCWISITFCSLSLIISKFISYRDLLY